MVTPYPTSLAPEDWQIVLDAIQGRFPNQAHAAHCVWDAIGFGLGQLDKDPTAAQCEFKGAEHCITQQVLKGVTVNKINWANLIQILIKLLPLITPFLNPAPASPVNLPTPAQSIDE
jgi:hypothetical protein